MAPSLLLLLLLLLTALSGVASQQTQPSALGAWLQDDTARAALVDAWGGDEPPLALAADAADDPSTGDEHFARCLADVRFLLNASDPGAAQAAYSMLDASVKLPEGLLAMVWTHLGNWYECVGVRDVMSPSGSFNGQMCIVKLFPTMVGNSGAQFYELERPVPLGANMGLLSQYLSMLSFNMAECVPSSCSHTDVQRLFKPLVDRLPTVRGIQMSVSVAASDCTVQDRPAFDTSDWVAVAILSALGVLLVLSTAYDAIVPAAQKKAVLAAFSVVANGRKLLAMPRGGGDQSLSCLHGMRFLSMMWVLVGHRYMFSAQVPTINPAVRSSLFGDWYRIGLTNATLSVDTFFVISGLLVGYLFFKQEPSKRRLNVPMYYIHRYIRLTPALAMMVLLTATLIPHVGWGPLWTSTMEASKEGCRKSWWNTLLYIANYFDPNEKCVDQSWYLMVDMQLHWLSPLLILTMTHHPHVGGYLLIPLVAAGLIGNFVFSYVADLPSNTSTADDHMRKYFMRWFYMATYARFLPYVEGFAVGYILGNQSFRNQKPRPLSRLFSLLAWLAVAALLLVPLCTGYDFVQIVPPSTLPTAFYNSLHRPVWGLGIVLAIYLCANGNGGPVNDLLSWWGFQVLGRFSYCVYLVHMSLQLMQWATMRTLGYFSDNLILSQFAGDLLLSLIFGGILSLVCESPFIVLEKELMGGHRVKKSEPNASGHRSQAEKSRKEID